METVDNKLYEAIAAILDVEKRFTKGELGNGDEADTAAVEAIEKIILNIGN